MNELQKALARQQELVTLARNEGRDLTAEEQAEFNRCQAVIDAAGNEGGEAGGQPERDQVFFAFFPSVCYN